MQYLSNHSTEVNKTNITNLDQCMTSKTMNPFGCITDNRVKFNDYCKEYNTKKFLTNSCNSYYLKSSPKENYWNNNYNCLKTSNSMDLYGKCLASINK